MGKYPQNKKIFVFFLLGFFIIAFQVSALELDWPLSPVSGVDLNFLTEGKELPQMVKYLYEWGITLGGLAAFIALIMAGFQYLTSAGNENAMKEAKDKIQSAILGLVLLLSSWLILNTINPQLTTLFLPSTDFSQRGGLECNSDIECKQKNAMYGQNYICTDPNQIDDKYEGICLPALASQKVCTKAILYMGPNYESAYPGQIIVDEARDSVSPLSVQAFSGNIDCCDETAKDEGYYGCGCYLQIFAGVEWGAGWATCRDMENTVGACETNIITSTDKPVNCVKLIKASQ